MHHLSIPGVQFMKLKRMPKIAPSTKYFLGQSVGILQGFTTLFCMELLQI